MTMNKKFQVESPVDVVLLLLLAAVCMQRDHIELGANKRNGNPFNDVLGALGRHSLRNAIEADPKWPHRDKLRQYRLHNRWDHLHLNGEVTVEEDHVIPLNEWKTPLRKRAFDEDWQVNERGLQGIRQFVLDYYVTALIPKSLHRELARGKMPENWRMGSDAQHSMWARYAAEDITKFLEAPLKFPVLDEPDPDFVTMFAFPAPDLTCLGRSD